MSRSHNPGRNCFLPVWADPRSLATTRGVSVDVLSTRYLDVSVPWVRFSAPMNSVRDDRVLARPGFPIRRSTDQSSLSSSPWLIAARYVLHRLLPPRHSPHALTSLTKNRLPKRPRAPRINWFEHDSAHTQRRLEHGTFERFSFQRSNRLPEAAGWILSRPRARRRRSGGADRDRTDDLRLAKPALSQLSYSP